MDIPDSDPSAPAVGVIGGSGLYEIEGFEGDREFEVETPFGRPSDTFVGGTLHGRTVYFLPRHGRGHGIAPHEINHRANIYAMRMLGVRWIICVTAAGSLQEQYAPRDIVLPAQFYDRTSRRENHTFFGEGIVAHISFAEPISRNLRTLLAQSCSVLRKSYHSGGTYVNIEGPQFSTRAESETYRSAGHAIVGMTNLVEAKLAREAQIAYATVAMVTDYDCWHPEHDSVTVEMVIQWLHKNTALAQKIIVEAIPRVAKLTDAKAHEALKYAILTQKEHWPAATAKKLALILG